MRLGGCAHKENDVGMSKLRKHFHLFQKLIFEPLLDRFAGVDFKNLRGENALVNEHMYEKTTIKKYSRGRRWDVFLL